jgi:hypothetical protein
MLDYLPNHCLPNIFLRYEMDVDLRVWMIAPYQQFAVSVLLFAMLFSSQKNYGGSGRRLAYVGWRREQRSASLRRFALQILGRRAGPS